MCSSFKLYHIKKKVTFHKMNRDVSKMIKIFSILFICLISSMAVLAGQPNLVPHQINLKNGKRFSLNLPANYDIIPAAEGLKRVRFLAKHLTVECLSRICTI